MNAVPQHPDAVPGSALITPPQPSLPASQPAPRPVYFLEVLLITPRNPRRIDLVRAPNSADLPEPMRALIREIGEFGRVIARVFEEILPTRCELFEQLHKSADLGLRGDGYSVEAALSNLAELKGLIADAFPEVRDSFWSRNFIFLLWALLPAAIGGVIYALALTGTSIVPPRSADGVFAPMVAGALALFWIPFGVALGLFLEFSYSVDRDIPYEDLQGINPGRWRPRQRLVNTLLTAYCFAALMALGAFQIGVLSILLNNFATTNPLLSFAVGFVTGFAFPYVRDLIYRFKPVQK
jgi:hypothetical protein